MSTVNIYLNFNGNCKEAFQFYQSIFESDFSYFSQFKEMPKTTEGFESLSEEDGEKVVHVSLPISKETCLMGSDNVGEYCMQYKAGNNFSIAINAESPARADMFFTKLSEGGKIVMPMATTFWGAYFGMLVDKFGINWMINFDEIQ